MRRAFTLIELLVVIAIIGILAAISFPVFARAKDSAYRSSDISNMNSLRTALQVYKADQEGVPPALLGYVTGYSNFTPTDADVVPANAAVSALYPKRVESLDAFRPSTVRPASPNLNREFTTATWPSKFVDTTVAPANSPTWQRFGPGEGPNNGLVSRCVGPEMAINYYYRLSGYDAAQVTIPGGSRVELRYAPFWSGFTVPSVCTATDAPGSINDDPRQLGYANPPETTVVTWNSFYRDYQNGVPVRTKRDLVLFWGGSARAYDSADVALKSWQVLP